MSRPFAARYGGPCAADCGERIHAGDEVVYVDDELMHTGCVPYGDHPADPRPGPAACPSCWTVHAGECM
jgi:hypothetical protein